MIDYSPGKKIEDAVEAYEKFDRQLAAVVSQSYLILEDSGRLYEENAKLRELASNMYKNMQGVLRLSTDTVLANDLVTLRDCMDEHMESMAELGMPPSDYEIRKRELGIEVI